MALLRDPHRVRSALHPGGTTTRRAAVVPPGRKAGRGAGHRWERLADTAFYGLAASVVLLVVVRELTGTTLPAGAARGVTLAGCALVTLVVAGIVLRRR